jgi:hypothetical protein
LRNSGKLIISRVLRVHSDDDAATSYP